MSERKIKLILKDFEMNNYAETNTQIYQLNTKQNTYLLVSIQVLKAKNYFDISITLSQIRY